MGVMACNRRGCCNVLSTRYSEQYGYICTDCFNELVSHFMVFEGEVDIQYFMDTKRPPYDEGMTERQCREILDEEFKSV